MPARRHHPTLPPSSFPALAECPQYKSSSEAGLAAIRGTRIGATVEAVLLGAKVPEAYSPEELQYKYTDEALEIEWVVKQLDDLYGAAKLEIEQEVTLVNAKFEEVTFGTLDYYAPGHLSDLKTGERRNYRRQMAVLSVALMDRDGLDEMKVTLLWSKFRETESWTWTREAAEALVWPVVETVKSGAAARPCAYCSWCVHRETCAARVNAFDTLPAVVSKHDTMAEYMDSLTPEERGVLYRKIKVAARWCEDAGKAVESWFLASPEQHPMTGYRLGEIKAKRVWHNDIEAGVKLHEKAVEMKRDPNGLWETKLVGTTKVKEILGQSKAVTALIDSLLFQPDPRPSVVEDWIKTPLPTTQAPHDGNT